MPKETMSVPEVSETMGLGRTATYDAIKRGDIPALRIGRRIVVPRRALEALLDGAARRPGPQDGRLRWPQ